MTIPSSNHIFSLGDYHLVFHGSDEFERLDSQGRKAPLVLLPIFL